jgi:hypothetical protein
MGAFEKIMTNMGRRVFRFFFLISALLMCKACAQYFFLAEKNFKCPICEILKTSRKPTSLTVNFTECINCYSSANSLTKYKTKKTHFQTTSILFKEQVHRYLIFELKQFRELSVSNTNESEKLYLLFNQLKVGNCC